MFGPAAIADKHGLAGSGNTVFVRRAARGHHPIHQGTLEVGSLENRTGQVGAAQVRAGQVGTAQSGALQVGVPQVGPGEIGKIEARTGQVGPLKVGVREVDPVEHRPGQITGGTAVGLDKLLKILLHHGPCRGGGSRTTWQPEQEKDSEAQGWKKGAAHGFALGHDLSGRAYGTGGHLRMPASGSD